MTFLQPLALFGLLLALAPIIIHLLNLLRHRTQAWAATRFLLQARKSSSRVSKLKRWLTLLFRVLALGALAFMLSRPMTGGDSLFSLSKGSPEALILVLDRSASMETRTETDPRTKREIALEAFQSFAKPWPESRLVVIDSALREPFFIDDAASVKDPSLSRYFGPTDTAADLPGTLIKAIEWLNDTGVGTAEILLASDMQASNWELDGNSDAFVRINRELKEKEDFWKLTLLQLDDTPPYNLNLAFEQVNRKPKSVEPVLNLSWKGTGSERVLFSTNTNGKPGNLEVDLSSQSTLWRPSFQLEDEPDEGWISILSPDDFCLSDNVGYLIYGATEPPKVAVRSQNPRVSLILRSASQTEDGDLADSLPAGSLDLKDLGIRRILAHQGKFDAEDDATLQRFVNSGGTLVLFPPDSPDSSGFSFLSWEAREEKKDDNFFYVNAWRKDSGLLANSSDGNRLPLDKLDIRIRRVPIQGEPIAYYSDGKPFLTSLTMGKGVIYSFSTLPLDDWSGLSNGYVLVPALQRLIEESSSSNTFIQSWACGGKETRDAILTDFESMTGGKDPSLEAGVYRVEGRLTAVNRPREENEAQFLKAGMIGGKLPGITPRIMDGENVSESTDRTEVWSFFLILCLVLLLGEAFLGQPALASKPDAQATSTNA
tara:strand:- start:9037 stop:11007 length:1971 start_codon:yes stop_codon:yes gene_type:complete